jgi:hypothetical protein
MEIRTVDFFLGAVIGIAITVAATFIGAKVRTWLGYSEIGRLKAENRDLKRRLVEKDRHITRMLQETERLAEKLGEGKVICEVTENKEGAV